MQQKKLIILLADISGYTQFMLDSATSAVHGQMAINALIESIIAQVDIPLVLQEIEGDAVFLYAPDPGTEEGWQRAVWDVSRKLDTFFTAFMAQLAITAESTPCTCAVCGNFEKLGLKIIVHAGEAMFHSVAGRAQVSGPDVILAHRLLKNSLPSHEYLLLSDQAYVLMKSHITDNFERHVEKYEGFGEVSLHVRFLHEDFLKARDEVYHLDEAEHQAAVDGYLHWAAQSRAQALHQQEDNLARKFSWWERLPLMMESLMAPLALPFYRRLITRQQRTRGSRRER